MNDQYVRNVIEAALLAAGRPLAADELVGLFDERDGSAADEVRGAIAALQSEYETRGIELVEVASGFRIQIRAAVAPARVAPVAGAPHQVLARACSRPSRWWPIASRSRVARSSRFAASR